LLIKKEIGLLFYEVKNSEKRKKNEGLGLRGL